MTTAALIGANHAHQLPGNRHGKADVFQTFVTLQAERLGADLVAEEMSSEGLEKWRVDRSSVQEAAKSLGLEHVLCDPDSKEGRALGIPSYDELRAVRGSVEVSDSDDDEIKAAERRYWHVREREWLRRVEQVNHRKVLFVVGPDHVESFARMLREASYEVHIICARWEA